MDINSYISTLTDPNEKPLDRMVTDGGFCSIFRTIACIGDSLSSGEFESTKPDGTTGYHDMFEYSWGQFMARAAGCKVYNFSKGGMTAKEYLESFADRKGFWNEDLACQAYMLALGVNDLSNFDLDSIGTVNDALKGFDTNHETFAGYYGEIIRRYRKIQPRAKFFLITTLRDPSHSPERKEKGERHAELLREIAKETENTYVIDLMKYGPAYDDDFHSKFCLGFHLNPMGYRFTADMIMSYVDYIVRHNLDDFKKTGFIGTDLL